LSLQHTSAAAIRPSVLSPQRTVLTWQQGSKLDRLLFHEVSVLARRAGDLARGKPQVVAADARMDSAQAIESGLKTLTGGHVQQARRSLIELDATASFGMKDLQVYRTVCGVTALLTAVSQRLRSSVKVEWPAILEAEASIADLCCAMIDVLWKHSVLHEGEGERRSPPAGIDASDLNLGLSSYTLSGVLAKAPELATTRWLILACSREIATGERFLDRTVFKAHISVRRLPSLQRRQRDTANEELHRTADALLGRVLLQDMVVLASPQLSAARREVVMKQAVMPASALRLAADPPAVPPHRIQQVLSNALYLLTRANLIAHYAAVILPLLSVDGILSAEQAHAESRGRHLWRHLLGPTLLGLASRYSVASSEELALLTRIAADYTAACAEDCQPRAITLLASASSAHARRGRAVVRAEGHAGEDDEVEARRRHDAGAPAVRRRDGDHAGTRSGGEGALAHEWMRAGCHCINVNGSFGAIRGRVAGRRVELSRRGHVAAGGGGVRRPS
jgi:hypothetical protein